MVKKVKPGLDESQAQSEGALATRELQTLVVYLFNPETGEYTEPYEAQESPLEPDQFITPVYSTNTPPPARSINESAFMVAGAWVIEPDFRKAMLFSTINGAHVEVSSFGPQPANTTDKPRPSDLHEWVNSDWVINADRQLAALQAKLEAAVQAHIDSAAKALGYDSAFTAVTYADEPAVAKFQSEGKAIRAWRSLVWAAAYDQLVKSKTTGSIPTEQELMASLPTFKAP